MSEDLERELRAGLRAAAVLPPPPADLADRAERQAGRIRRRRYAAVAAAVVIALVVPFAAVNAVRGMSRSLPPANPACRVDPTPPAQEPARTAADVTAWPVRGSVAARAGFPAAFLTWSKHNTNADSTDPRRVPSEPHLLYAERVRGWGTVYVFATRVLGEWRLGLVGAGSEYRVPLVNAPMPRLGPATVLSGLLAVDFQEGGPLSATGWDERTNLLWALAAPGASEIRFAGCYRNQPFTVVRPGGTLFREVGAMDTVGRLAVPAGGRTFSGAPGLDQFTPGQLVLPAVEPIPVPDGYRVLQPGWRGVLSQADNRSSAGWMFLENDITVRIEGVRVLVRCEGAGSVGIRINDEISARDASPVPCDGRVHTGSEPMVVGQASQVQVDSDLVPSHRTYVPTSIRIMVVAPVR
jgi:hypothetical protein